MVSWHLTKRWWKSLNHCINTTLLNCMWLLWLLVFVSFFNDMNILNGWQKNMCLFLPLQKFQSWSSNFLLISRKKSICLDIIRRVGAYLKGRKLSVLGQEAVLVGRTEKSPPWEGDGSDLHVWSAYHLVGQVGQNHRPKFLLEFYW